MYWYLVFGLEEEINSFISLFIGIGSTFTTLIVPLDALDGWFVLPKSAICFRGTNLEFVGAPSKTCQNFKRCKVLMKVRHNFKLLHGYLAMGLSGSWKFCIVLQSYKSIDSIVYTLKFKNDSTVLSSLSFLVLYLKCI